jgi:hypothetical protein
VSTFWSTESSIAIPHHFPAHDCDQYFFDFNIFGVVESILMLMHICSGRNITEAFLNGAKVIKLKNYGTQS